MGAWAIASLFVASIFWIEGEANPQLLQNYQQQQTQEPRQQQYGYFFYSKNRPVGVAKQLQSASSLKPHTRPTVVNINHSPLQTSSYYTNNLLGNTYPTLDFNKNFDQNLDTYIKLHQRKPQTFPLQGASKRYSEDDQHLEDATGYDDYSTSHATNILGPHQVETIQSQHFHKKVPAFDVSDFDHHQTQEKHGEVHYHQHKHVHKHDHKQEHMHQHKNDHLHKHLHHQEHKHEHESTHKHGHQHKHDHHQEHKHDHHHGHKHDHHQQHKHDHHHGHKHQHHSESKHEHKHGHKHNHKHGQDHKHKHQHSKHY